LAPLVALLSIVGMAEAAIALESVASSSQRLALAQTAPAKLSQEKPFPLAVGLLASADESTSLAPPGAEAAAIAESPLKTETPAPATDDYPVVATPPPVVGEIPGSVVSVVQPPQPAASLTVPPATLAAELMPLNQGDVPLEETPSPEVISQTTDAPAATEVPWRFVLEPYLYLPFETSGDVTVNNIEVPFDYDLGEVLESLTFATYGRFEAWQGPWAFVLDGYYFNTVESESVVVNTPPQLQGQLPGEINIDGTAETSVTKLDFAGAYRFGDGNLPNALATADTEFDLGPFIFDAIAGVRFYFFSNDIELTSDIGQEFDFSRSATFVEPLLGGRARWNLSDNLAVLAAANVSGLGIGDMTFSLESYAGIDWLFSGNTSMTVVYRVTYIDYDRDSSGLNFFQHGPALGVKFRF
jgi:hypothetical protein